MAENTEGEPKPQGETAERPKGRGRRDSYAREPYVNEAGHTVVESVRGAGELYALDSSNASNDYVRSEIMPGYRQSLEDLKTRGDAKPGDYSRLEWDAINQGLIRRVQADNGKFRTEYLLPSEIIPWRKQLHDSRKVAVERSDRQRAEQQREAQRKQEQLKTKARETIKKLPDSASPKAPDYLAATKQLVERKPVMTEVTESYQKVKTARAEAEVRAAEEVRAADEAAKTLMDGSGPTQEHESIPADVARGGLAADLGMNSLLNDVDAKLAEEVREKGQREFEEKGETRPELTDALREEAYAAKPAFELAMAQAKAGRIENAQKFVEKAKALGQAAAEQYETGVKQDEARAEQATQQMRASVMEAVEAMSAGQAKTIEVAAVEGDPAVNRLMSQELRDLIDAGAEPVDVKKWDDRKKGIHFTDIVWSSGASPKLALVERYNRDGQYMGAHLVATEKPAFKRRFLGRGLKPGAEVADLVGLVPDKMPESLDFSGSRRTVVRERVDYLKQRAGDVKGQLGSESGVGAGGGGADLASYRPVTQRLEGAGYDEATIAAVTRRKTGKSTRRRQGFWAGLFGR